MEIPWEKLPPDTLKGVIEEFVTRLGTDNGYIAGGLEDNIMQVRRMLDSGQARMTFDPATGSCNIVTRDNT